MRNVHTDGTRLCEGRRGHRLGKAAKKTSYKPSTKKKGRKFYRCRVTHTAGKSSKNRVSKVFRVTVK